MIVLLKRVNNAAKLDKKTSLTKKIKRIWRKLFCFARYLHYLCSLNREYASRYGSRHKV